MVNPTSKKGKKKVKIVRQFSEEVKREVVRQIESQELGVSKAAREYGVSGSAIYKWMYRYSLHLKKGNIVIVEKKSQTKLIHDAHQRIAELERIIGQKQLELDILNKLLEFGSKEVGFDIKKKYNGRLFDGTEKTGKNFPTR